MKLGLWSALSLLAACKPDPAGWTESGDTGADPLSACGEDPPAFDVLTVQGVDGPHGPGLAFLLLPTDPDGALHFFTLQVWHDLVVDGTVDRTGDPTWRADFDVLASGTVPGAAPCKVTGGFPTSFVVPIEDRVPLGTWVEFAADIVDADGLVSQPVVAVACTPDEAGALDCP